jgi:signal transduction histidine kinase
MQVSKRFLALLDQQLAQFTDRPDLRALVVYAALPGDSGQPTLMAIGHWPAALALSGDDPLDVGSGGAPEPDTRRWLALRDGTLLLGALRVDAEQLPWPPALEARLEATARCLTQALRLDQDQQQLGRELARREDQLRLLVHQLRNPLAALRTFGQLLRRRLDGDAANLTLVDNLLHEQGQINRYLEAIEAIDQPAAPSLAAPGGPTPLLLPPGLQGTEPQPLEALLGPLLQRAAATASLQGRPWHGPTGGRLPSWRGDANAVAEILANLLENAFRYSRGGGAIGLLCQGENGPNGTPEALTLAVWDSGPEIPPDERTRIFERGQRGSTGAGRPGSGLGLALARELAAQLGGSLELQVPPAALDPHNPDLPSSGNAFCLRLP